jgi:hypothetical protein
MTKDVAPGRGMTNELTAVGNSRSGYSAHAHHARVGEMSRWLSAHDQAGEPCTTARLDVRH